jgi:hypothetical protein
MTSKIGQVLKTVVVNDRMQREYRYHLVASVGRGFDPEFKPDLTPREILELGVFCGKYITDSRGEFPKSWFKRAKLSPSGRDCSLNYFGVAASRPLSEWRRMGRRMAEEDRRQIRRWKSFRRHVAQVKSTCEPGDRFCRPRQRQALLQWAYDSRKI